MSTYLRTFSSDLAVSGVFCSLTCTVLADASFLWTLVDTPSLNFPDYMPSSLTPISKTLQTRHQNLNELRNGLFRPRAWRGIGIHSVMASSGDGAHTRN